MAETTKNTNNAKKRVTVRLPRNKGKDARQEEFYSHNFKNYIVKRGETVEIPECVANIIKDAEQAEEYAMQYAEGLVQAEANKKRELGIN